MPKHKYSFAPEILEHSQAHRPPLSTSTTTRCSRPRSPSCAGTRTPRAGSSPPIAATGSRRSSSPWPTARSAGRSCPASPASTSSRATRSTPAAGTTATPAATIPANLDRPRRQARRHHRHRRHRHPVHPAPRRMGEASLRLPAHAVLGRRPQQRRDRSGLGRLARARLAAAADGQLQHPRQRRRPGRGPRPGRLDRHLPQPHGHRGQGGLAEARPPAHRGRARRADGARRLPEDEPGPRPGGRDRRRTGDGRGAEALVPPVLQAARASTTSTCRPSTGRTSRWSTPTARASSG